MTHMDREQIRPLTTVEEFSELVSMQREIWGLADSDVVPAHTFKAVSSFMGPNGMVLGYLLDGQLVGYALTFPTSNPEEALCDMLGVSRIYQGQGIGYKLALALRATLLQSEVNTISWTFDPLESTNANLYLAKLGGIVTRHFKDFYGVVTSQLHSGLPTDRFKVEWKIRSKRVEERIQRRVNGHDDFKETDRTDIKQVEVPLNIQDLRSSNMKAALEWRMKTRTQFDDFVEKQRLIGTDFIFDSLNQKGIYLFQRPDTCATSE
jgi:predicted GNAT superfamily acetyltransferase